jgi:hypothetical protein
MATAWLSVATLAFAFTVPQIVNRLRGIDAAAAIVLFTVLGVLFAFFLIAQQATRYVSSTRAWRETQRGHRYILYLRSSEIDHDPQERTFESSLVRALATIGPTISVAPFTLLRRSAAIRLSFADDAWESEVAKLAARAALVVIALAPRRGYDHASNAVDGVWTELETLPEALFVGRVLLYCGRHWDDHALTLINRNGTMHFGTTTLINEVRRVLPEPLAHGVPDALSGSRWLWFHPSGLLVGLGAGHAVSRVQAFRRLTIRDELAPVVESFAVRQQSWTPLLPWIGLAIGAYAAVTLVLVVMRDGVLGIGAHPRTAVIVGLVAWSAVVGLRFPLMRSVYYRWRYGEYENFVLASKYYRG